MATFLHGDAEVLELEVANGSPADGSLVSELELPKDALIAAFVRDGSPKSAAERVASGPRTMSW